MHADKEGEEEVEEEQEEEEDVIPTSVPGIARASPPQERRWELRLAEGLLLPADICSSHGRAPP